ncbi:hypothetical protein PVAP13_J683502 [Panicum virgatum]|nr:hypothetical protein PVAP13_J683502 [Panicum virgatum]
MFPGLETKATTDSRAQNEKAILVSLATPLLVPDPWHPTPWRLGFSSTTPSILGLAATSVPSSPLLATSGDLCSVHSQESDLRCPSLVRRPPLRRFQGRPPPQPPPPPRPGGRTEISISTRAVGDARTTRGVASPVEVRSELNRGISQRD